MPFVTVEAEALSNKTTGTRLAPNRKLADYAGEAAYQCFRNLLYPSEERRSGSREAGCLRR